MRELDSRVTPSRDLALTAVTARPVCARDTSCSQQLCGKGPPSLSQRGRDAQLGEAKRRPRGLTRRGREREPSRAAGSRPVNVKADVVFGAHPAVFTLCGRSTGPFRLSHLADVPVHLPEGPAAALSSLFGDGLDPEVTSLSLSPERCRLLPALVRLHFLEHPTL